MAIQHQRIFGLDLLRTIAVVFVLSAHTIPYLASNQFIFASSVFQAICGVEIFFVISGFLIGTILIKMHNQDTITSFKSIKIFWIRRWFRTLPNYYLMLFVYAALYYIATKHFIFSDSFGLSYLFFLQNFTSEITNYFYGISWSLAVEEWFYLLFPLFLFISQLMFKKKQYSFLVVVGVFIAVPLLIRTGLVVLNSDFAWDAGFRKMVPLRLDGIGIGVAVAYIKWYVPNLWEKNKKVYFTIGSLATIFLLTIFYYRFILNYDFPTEKELVDPGFFLKTLFFTLLSFSIALMIPLIYDMKDRPKNFFYKSISFLSVISYSVYLSHPFYIVLVNRYLSNQSTLIQFFTIWILTIVGSYLQYRFFELKFTSLRDKFGSKRDKLTV